MSFTIYDVSPDRYKNWHFKNTTLLIMSIVMVIAYIDSPAVRTVVDAVTQLGYFGAFVAGIFFVLTFTAVPAGIILFSFAETHNPFMVAIMGGIGGMMGDYLILRLFREYIFDELAILFKNAQWRRIKKLFRTPYFAWILPIIGASLIIAPGPDEPGIALMGLSRMKTWQFMLLTLVLDTIGILLIVFTLRQFV